MDEYSLLIVGWIVLSLYFCFRTAQAYQVIPPGGSEQYIHFRKKAFWRAVAYSAVLYLGVPLTNYSYLVIFLVGYMVLVGFFLCMKQNPTQFQSDE